MPELFSSLIDELLSDPRSFYESGRGNDLLQEFGKKKSFDTLKTLMQNQDTYVIRTAVWIASELGPLNKIFVENAVALLTHKDFYVRCYCLEIILVNSRGDCAWMFKFILEHLADPDHRVRWMALKLSRLADLERLKAAQKHFHAHGTTAEHGTGINLLISAIETSIMSKEVLKDSDLLSQSYAVIEAMWSFERSSKTMLLMKNSPDENLSTFESSIQSAIYR